MLNVRRLWVVVDGESYQFRERIVSKSDHEWPLVTIDHGFRLKLLPAIFIHCIYLKKKKCNSGNPPLVSIPIKHDVETLASRGTGTKYAFHTYIVEVSAVIAEHEVV